MARGDGVTADAARCWRWTTATAHRPRDQRSDAASIASPAGFIERRAGKRRRSQSSSRAREELEARGLRVRPSARRRTATTRRARRSARASRRSWRSARGCPSRSSTSASPPPPRCAPCARWAAAPAAGRATSTRSPPRVLLSMRCALPDVTRCGARRARMRAVAARALASRCSRCGRGRLRRRRSRRASSFRAARSMRAAADSLRARGVIGSAAAVPAVRASCAAPTAASRPGPTCCSAGRQLGRACSTALAQRQGRRARRVTIPEGLRRCTQIEPLLVAGARGAARTPCAPRCATRRCCGGSTSRRRRSRATCFPTRTRSRTGRTRARRGGRRWSSASSSAGSRSGTRASTRLAMTRHDVMTLASIVEKEARCPRSGRSSPPCTTTACKTGMLLQADPTVQYALPAARGARAVQGPRDRIAVQHLPVTRDCRPDRSRRPASAEHQRRALPGQRAVPVSSSRIPDGHHEFRTTFAEHIAAVARSRRACATRSRGRAPPRRRRRRRPATRRAGAAKRRGASARLSARAAVRLASAVAHLRERALGGAASASGTDVGRVRPSRTGAVRAPCSPMLSPLRSAASMQREDGRAAGRGRQRPDRTACRARAMTSAALAGGLARAIAARCVMASKVSAMATMRAANGMSSPGEARG